MCAGREGMSRKSEETGDARQPGLRAPSRVVYNPSGLGVLTTSWSLVDFSQN